MKKIRQGFSMIELLFVMVIMAALAAIAIPNLSSGTNSAIMVSMKEDTRNVISQLRSEYISNNNDYTTILTADETHYKDEDGDGIADQALESGTYIRISDGNDIRINYIDKDNFFIWTTNPAHEPKAVYYNSELGGKIIVSD
jgi:prepilin-type N-terminal cleavage/methylation domain-containing protein